MPSICICRHCSAIFGIALKRALLLEHGCEKTHNDAVRHYLQEQGLGTDRFGWASVQLDGGIAGVSEVIAWFSDSLRDDPYPQAQSVGVEALRLGAFANGDVSDRAAEALARLTSGIVNGGGTVVIPAQNDLLRSAAFRTHLLADTAEPVASLAANPPRTPGCTSCRRRRRTRPKS